MFSAFIDVLGWSLIHSLWQSALLFVVLKLLLRLLRKGPARLRYLLTTFGMAGIFVSFLFTYYTLWQQAIVSQALTDTTTASQASVTAASTLLLQGASSGPAASGFFQDGLFYLVVLYAVGLLFSIGKSVRDLMFMQHIRYSRIRPFDRAWDRHLQKLAATWNISRKVGLYLSEKVEVPAVIGYLKPVIYLPISIANHLTPEQIEAILLHELAHVKRGDFIINLLQNIVEALLFFNPFVWWLSRNMSRERELACDEMVLLEKEPQLYAQSLLALAENRAHQGGLVLAAAGKKQQLLHRIKHITTMKTQKLNALQKTMVLLSMVVAVFSISWLVPEKQPQQPANSVVTKTQSHRLTAGQDTIPPGTAVSKAGGTQTIPPTPQMPAAADVPAPPDAPQPPAPSTVTLPAAPASPATGIAAATLPAAPTSSSVQFYRVGNGSARAISFTDSLPPDAFTLHMDSMSNSIKGYFNSDEWKEYMQGIKSISAKMKQEMNSADWQAYKDSMHTYVNKVHQYFKSDEWKDQMTQLKDKLRQIKQNLHSESPPEQNKTTWFVHQLQADGLLNTNADYKIRLDNRGLYINGRKQSDTDYQKYRKMFPEAKIKIKKDGGSYSSTFSSSHEDH